MLNEETEEKEPKDLGAKFGSVEQAAWKVIRDNAKRGIEQAKREMIITETVLKLADNRYRLEKKKFELELKRRGKDKASYVG